MPLTLVPRAFSDYAASSPVAYSVMKPHGAFSPSMPILYFGDLDAYRSSERRIITVGVNPSFEEFPQSKPWLRFPRCGRAYSPANPVAAPPVHDYQSDLNSYFDSPNAYMKWFGHMTHVLMGFGADYKQAPGRHRVLHTDLLTPIPTDPVWSKLQPVQQALLSRSGVNLWMDLVEKLKPHIVLASLSSAHKMLFDTLHIVRPWKVVHSIPKASNGHQKQIDVKHQVVQLKCGSQVDIVFAPKPQRQPFSGLTNIEKAAIGPALKRKLTNW